jgi:hypothetical protein
MEPVTSIFLFPVSAVYGANVYGWLDSLAYGTDGTWHVTVTGAGLAWLTSLVTTWKGLGQNTRRVPCK